MFVDIVLAAVSDILSVFAATLVDYFRQERHAVSGS